MGAIPAGILGASSLGGAALGGKGASRAAAAQAESARESMAQQERLGREGAGAVEEFGNRAAGELLGGSGLALDELARASNLFAQEREVGSEALSRLQEAILGGGGLQALVDEDPTINFERQEGERALARAASASGQLGGGASTRAFLELNQQLAGRGVDRALTRLGGLFDIGRQADVTTAGILGNRAQVQDALGANLASIQQGIGGGIASSLAGVAQQQGHLQQALAGAQAAQAAAFPTAFAQALPGIATAAALPFLGAAQLGAAQPTALPGAGTSAFGIPQLTPPSIPGLGGF